MEKKDSLWSIYKKGLIAENPIFVLALSLCPSLAVTGSVQTALTMGLSVLFVITANNTVVSLIRNIVNPKVRVPVYITSIATIVTLVELILQAVSPALYSALGIYLDLVVVFAIILARAETFASKNKVIPSFFDGLGMGSGFCLAMLLISVIREVIGAGTLCGIRVLPASYQPILLMILAPGAFILIGFLVAMFKVINEKAQERKAERGEA
ncbi:electron transport complex subunit RsxE [Clostridium sp. JN-1]|uniref:electron transport complex subunit RsxE n=1 Tax=Clostridium sp. JN-1 TaxID=2483110 RepID=UPI000F0BA50B|nr:electron transport complex subunit RsxE [Clostridium sp. JN-1]